MRNLFLSFIFIAHRYHRFILGKSYLVRSRISVEMISLYSPFFVPLWFWGNSVYRKFLSIVSVYYCFLWYIVFVCSLISLTHWFSFKAVFCCNIIFKTHSTTLCEIHLRESAIFDVMQAIPRNRGSRLRGDFSTKGSIA